MKNVSRHLLRLSLLLPIIIAIILVFYFNLNDYLSFSAIKTHKDWLLFWIQAHYWLAVGTFILVYIIAVALSIPGAVFLTLTGGFLFGALLGTIYVVISATIGATFIFWLVQFSIGQWLAEKNSNWVGKLQKGFQQNAFQYLLFLRLVPLFPFPIVNIVPGILNVRPIIFIIATFIGIIPGTFVYAWLGHGLGNAFTTGKAPNMSIIFSPQVFWPLIALATLALVPILYKRFTRKTKCNQIK